MTAAAPPRPTADGFNAAWPLISEIEGWLSAEQAAVLYRAAGSVPDGSWIVEIGSHHGRSAVTLGTGKRPSVRFLAVDPFPARGLTSGELAYTTLRENLRGAGVANAHIFRGTSEEAASVAHMLFEVVEGDVAREASPPRPAIGLLYIDGLHDRDSVLADIDGWERFVVEGGLVIFHDAFFRLGVTFAVIERHVLNSRFRYLGAIGSMVFFRRERAVRPRESMSTSLRMLARGSGYLARNLTVRLALRKEWRPVLRLLPPDDSCEY